MSLGRVTHGSAPKAPTGSTPALKRTLEAYLSRTNLPELSKKPNLTGFTKVFIRDSRPVDGVRVDAWYDSRTRKVYEQVTGAGRGGPQSIGPFWYGPGHLPKASQPGPVSRPNPAKLKSTVAQAFSAQFPPTYSRILALDSSTLKFGATKNGVVPFTCTAEVFHGALVGMIRQGTQKFSGTYHLKSGAVTFTVK